MGYYNRNISIDIGHGENGTVLMTTTMLDPVHDITLRLYVSRTNPTIVDAEVEMTKVPGEACRLIVPVVKQLIGLNIARGFNRSASGILAGPRGCVNVMHMVLVSAPLALNAVYLDLESLQKGIPAARERKGASHFLKGVCIGHP